MHPDLAQMIYLSGLALEAEDCVLRNAIHSNPQAYPGKKAGLLHINNERYMQFAVFRSLLSSLSYACSIERDTHDLVLDHPGSASGTSPFAIVEMKRWMSTSGETEIPGIQKDLIKLSAAKAEHGLMMIFSANPPGQTTKEQAWLTSALSLSGVAWETYSFPTFNANGDAVEFWVGGF